jgi:hypothetical protein
LATSTDLFIGHGREQNFICIYAVLCSSEARAHLWRCFLKTAVPQLIPSRNVTKYLDCFIVVCMDADGFPTLSFKVLETSSSLFISSAVARVVSFAAYNKGICCFIGLPATEVCLES